MEEMKPRFKPTIWNIRKKKDLIRTARRNKNSKDQGHNKESLGHLQTYQHPNHTSCQKKKRKSKKLKTYLKK